MSNIIGIIGSGFASMASATFMAKEGYEVHLFEKNNQLGGRARQFKENGFIFDMGPSWYWMPDVFEKYFNMFGHDIKELYDLKLLDPAFTVFFGKEEPMQVPNSYEQLRSLFESIEIGSSLKLDKFMSEAAYKYEVGINDLVYKPSLSWTEFIDKRIIGGAFKLQLFSSFKKHVRKYFSNPNLIALMEFPILFLGAMPKNTPALYSLMNYAGLKLGTWYPMGGFGKVISAMESIATKEGVIFHLNEPIKEIRVKNNLSDELITDKAIYKVKGVIAGADYHHVDKELLASQYRNYSEKYWNNRVFAPSSLIFYLGISKKVKGLNHHNLFFDRGLEQHASEIYENPSWPTEPLFYVCCPSKTDMKIAPENCENIFILMPIAPELEDNETTRDKYFNIIMDRIEKQINNTIRDHIIVKKSYCVSDFKSDYNSFKGNAYGLANTLSQTAILKPRMQNKKIKNLFYTGQLTVPGPGVPPSIISGQVAAKELIKHLTIN